jgi:methylenetetrahydrofolate dehydrogenase (NADP+)/methenyltetrahydrofolate cyclohydrolase
MNLIDGRKIAEKILTETKNIVTNNKLTPVLAIILATDDVSSHTYVKLKAKRAEEIGVETNILKFESNISKEQLLAKIHELNNDSNIHGILIQLPLFGHLLNDTSEIVNSVNPLKDVDGLTAIQQGYSSQLLKEAIFPATVDAILECLNYTLPESNKIDWRRCDVESNFLNGKKVLIINNSILIGKPLSLILSSCNATVTIANKFTPDLKEIAKDSDILITATGQTNIIDSTMIKKDSILIDVTSEKRGDLILGDIVQSAKLEEKASWLTPVPGGVGPVTIACLLRNVVSTMEIRD